MILNIVGEILGCIIAAWCIGIMIWWFTEEEGNEN